jgi:NhaA family Na+:H+ antiporter
MKEKFSNAVLSFMRHETAGGIFLLAATALALIMANTGLAEAYNAYSRRVHLPINDGLMVIFFFFVGLEIKREMTSGDLSNAASARLPLIAAIAGMIMPAVIFIMLNLHAPDNLRGWAVPAATDIAFALGILSLAGRRAPAVLKILLLSIAVLDDLGAILIIALFYTASVSLPALAAAAAMVAGLYALKRLGVQKILPYVMLGVLLWAAVLLSGVHATIAGVITALFIPRGKISDLEHALFPWVAFGIVPLFAFANAGVSFAGLSFSSLTEPLPLGIMLGLFAGKQLGIFGGLRVAVALGLAKLPRGINWMHVYGLSALCGIGFTMSLFIGMLAFGNGHQMDGVKLGVLAGSLISAVWGFATLKIAAKKAA